MRSVRPLGVLLAWTLLGGCASSGIPLASLSPEPIAIVYRSREESERRQELLERKDPAAPGTMRLGDLEELLGLGANRQERMAAALGHVALLDPRTLALERLPSLPVGARPLCWSPDRERLLYAAPRRGILQLSAYLLERGEIRHVTRGPAGHPAGCYGPGGEVVAVEITRSPEGSRAHLVLLPPGGGPPRALTSGPADLEPVWSPDGRWIAYTALAPDGGRAIATLPADGSGEPRLIARGKEPTFTPDGAWVVYSGLSRGRWRLWQVRPEGMGRHPLGEGTFDEHDPSVAPDGRYVAFVVQQGDSVRQSLYVRRFEGGAGRPLLDYEEGASPTW